MKKFLSIVLSLAIVLSLFAGLTITASADGETKTIYVGVISYLIQESGKPGENGWQVYYWNSNTDGNADAIRIDNLIEEKRLGNDYWGNQLQSFYMYSAEIPADAVGFKVRNGSWWFGEDGDPSQFNAAFVFEYSGNKANYENYSYTPPQPSRLEDGYYLNVGIKAGVEGENFDVSHLTAAEKLVQTGDNTWAIDYTLNAGDALKVVYVQNDRILDNGWYPQSGGNHVVNYVEAGATTVTLTTNNTDYWPVTVAGVEGIKGYSISLDGDIGVNFYVFADDASAAKLIVEQSGKDDAELDLGNAIDDGSLKSGCYKVTARVAAKEMTDNLDVSLISGETVIDSTQVTVKEYAELLQNDSTSSDNLKALLNAMLVYGGAAQRQFNYNVNNPASTAAPSTEISGLQGNSRDDDVVNDIKTAWGLNYYGATLILESEVSYRLYFTKTADYDEAAAKPGVSCSIQACDLVWKDAGSYVYLEIKNIPAAATLENIKLWMEVKGVQEWPQFGTYNVGAYISYQLEHGDDNLKAVVAALYWYAKAAETYFG